LTILTLGGSMNAVADVDGAGVQAEPEQVA